MKDFSKMINCMDMAEPFSMMEPTILENLRTASFTVWERMWKQTEQFQMEYGKKVNSWAQNEPIKRQ